jgi:cobalt/nickel transport system ATP-binding protein
MDNIIEISCLKHRYEDGTQVHICNSHFSAKVGEVVIITGKNGSGKSTLLHHIVGLLEPTQGEVKVFGIDISSAEFEIHRKEIGMVLQDVDEQLIAPTVKEDICFSPVNYNWEPSVIEEKSNKIMKQLGIFHLKDKAPHYLSGGEKKKVALAGALIMNPKVLIIDELFANMDKESKKLISEILIKLNKENKTTIILTSHESEIIKNFNARIFHIN